MFCATFTVKGYGDKETAITEYYQSDTALQALAFMKETYGDKLAQIVSVVEVGEDDECDCNCGCNCS